MRQIVAEINDAVQAGKRLAYCRLVETRGSTPQKAGAAMLVRPDGSQVGTLGGGCVEAEVKRRALEVLAANRSSVSRFELDHDYGWDDGLICGGRMDVLVEPLATGEHSAYFIALAKMHEVGQGGTEVIDYGGGGENDAEESPACFLFDAQSQLVASLRAGQLESSQLDAIRANLSPLAERPRPRAVQGRAYLPILPRCRLIIVGGGHIGKAVAELADPLDFEVWIVDDREPFVNSERFPMAARCACGPIGQVLSELDVTPDTYCLIVTRGHSHDQEALYHLVGRGARYVGMIGSRRKIRLIFENLIDEGVPPEQLSRVYAPLGIDIGSQSVPEIAVSVAAELVSHRNRKGIVPGRPTAVVALQ